MSYQIRLWQTPCRFTKSGYDRHLADLLNLLWAKVLLLLVGLLPSSDLVSVSVLWAGFTKWRNSNANLLKCPKLFFRKSPSGFSKIRLQGRAEIINTPCLVDGVTQFPQSDLPCYRQLDSAAVRIKTVRRVGIKQATLRLLERNQYREWHGISLQIGIEQALLSAAICYFSYKLCPESP